jgi:hypothetical protein
VVAAHPYRRLGVCCTGTGDEICQLDLDAIELYHPAHDEEARRKVRTAAARLGIPLTGGSDAHELYQVGLCTTRFFNPVKSMQGLVTELKEGRVEPLIGVPSLWIL